MARWRVAQGQQQQFTAEDLAELQRFAREGKFGPGDLVQPPGASDWLYAMELPDLAKHLKSAPAVLDLDVRPRSRSNAPIVIALLLGIAGASYAIYHFASTIPQAEDLELLGDNGLSLTEMLMTVSAPVLQSAEDGAASTGTAAKDSKVALLAKRGPWYKIRSAEGAEGWVKVDQVVPAYLFADAKERQKLDPLYNPDRYVTVKNASWMMLPDQRKNNVTVFQFMLANESMFDMTDVKLLVTIRDTKGNALETKEVPVGGRIPARGDSMVGTLSPDPKDKEALPQLFTDATFLEMQREDPDLALRWSAGIEVAMQSKDFEKANVDLLEVRAIPKDVDAKPAGD